MPCKPARTMSCMCPSSPGFVSLGSALVCARLFHADKGAARCVLAAKASGRAMRKVGHVVRCVMHTCSVESTLAKSLHVLGERQSICEQPCNSSMHILALCAISAIPVVSCSLPSGIAASLV